MTPQEAIDKIHSALGVRTVIVASQLASYGNKQLAQHKYRITLFDAEDRRVLAEYGGTLEDATENVIHKAQTASFE